MRRTPATPFTVGFLCELLGDSAVFKRVLSQVTKVFANDGSSDKCVLGFVDEEGP